MRKKVFKGCPVSGTDGHNGQAPLKGDSSRRCDFCQRQLSEGFLFCPYCGKRIGLGHGPGRRWYHSKYAVAIGLATLGPFALPMVWSNPRYGVFTKVVLTVLTLAVTALLIYILYLLVIVCLRRVERIWEMMNAY